jgi:hypothetical protein
LRSIRRTLKHTRGNDIAEQLPQDQSVTLEELVISHSYEMLALITVLERKGILTKSEIIDVIKELKNSGS